MTNNEQTHDYPVSESIFSAFIAYYEANERNRRAKSKSKKTNTVGKKPA